VDVSANASEPGRDDRHGLSEPVRGRRLGVALLRACPRALLPPLAVLNPSAVHAEEIAPAQTAAVTVAARDDEVEAFLEGMREPLEALGLVVRASGDGDEGRPPTQDATKRRVRVVVDARPSDHVDILVWVEPSVRASAVLRRVPRGPSTAVVIEDVAYAVRATVESLLAEPKPAVLSAPRAPLPPPPAVRSHPDRFGVDVAGFAGLRGLASAPPAIGGGAALDFGFLGRRPGRPNLYLGASFYAPVETSTSEVTLDTMVLSFRAIPGIELARVGPLRLAVGAGGGIDMLHTEPHPSETSSSVTLGAATTLLDPVLETQALLRVVVGGASLFFGLDVDYDLQPHQYTEIDRSGASSSVLTEWPVRPAGMLGLCLPIAGACACKDAE
jgi:hypothetical protein